MTRPPLPSTRRTVLTTAAWTAPAILVVSAAPAFAVSGIGTMAVLATRGDTGNSIGTIDLTLDPEPLTTPVPVIAYDDPGTTTTSFVKTGASGTAGLYRLTFTSTTHPCPATITATIDVVGYGTTMPTVLMAAPGTLDTTFADPNLDNPAYDVAVQADNKVIATGLFTTAGPGNTPCGNLTRFHPDGTPDADFADLNLNNHFGRGLAIDENAMILVTGDFTTAGPDNSPYRHLARVNTDGTLDHWFANPYLEGTTGAWGVAVQTDGKILVAGDFTAVGAENTPDGQTAPYGHLVRLNPDGTLDTTFTNPNLGGRGHAVAIQPDGKVLVTGSFTTAGPDNTPYHGLARFNTDGTPDLSFTNPHLNQDVRGLAVQADGKILVTGNFSTAGPDDSPYRYLARVNPDGTLDTTFTNPDLDDAGLGATGWGVAVQDDGKILVSGGFVTAAGQPRNGLARLHSDGTLDTTFTNPHLRFAVAIAIDTDGKILVAGSFTTAGSGDAPYGRLARFHG